MKKNLVTIAVVFCCVMVASLFSSCSKKEYTYDLKFVVDGSVGPETGDVDEKSEFIIKTYEEALGVSSTKFTLTGKEADCDKKVKENCKKAEPTVDEIHGIAGTVLVKNLTSGSDTPVYSHQIKLH
jgi:hypothetical protein